MAQAESVKIRVRSNKNFIIAKVTIQNTKEKKYTYTDFASEDKCDMFWTSSTFKKKDLLEERTAKEFNNAPIKSVYWVRKKPTIFIPWGCCVENCKISGEFQHVIPEKCISILSEQYHTWETVKENGYTVQYLSDFFIDNEETQAGISLFYSECMRGAIENEISTLLKQEKSESDIKEEVIRCAIELLRKIYNIDHIDQDFLELKAWNFTQVDDKT